MRLGVANGSAVQTRVLKSEMSGHTGVMLLHAIPAYTGMPCGEILRLTWVAVDLDTVRFRDQKRPATAARLQRLGGGMGQLAIAMRIV